MANRNAKAVKRFRRLQDLIRIGDCVPCLAQAFDKWRHVNLLQILMFRLAEGAGAAPPGYHYEVFTDRMLRPATVTNGLSYDYDRGGAAVESPAFGRQTAEETEEVHRRTERASADWIGTEAFVEPSDPRLRAGDLYLNTHHEDTQLRATLVRSFSEIGSWIMPNSIGRWPSIGCASRM